MAKALDLEEQEQLDQIKHFWQKYGNLITWVLIVILGAYAAWNGYQYWQRDQAAKAAVLFDEVERAASSNDLARVQRSFADMKDRFPKTLFAHQAALIAAKSLHANGKTDEARASLKWVIDGAPDSAYRDIARLRLAGLLLDAGAHDEALSLLAQPVAASLMGLSYDLQGDIRMSKKQNAEATSAYRNAWQALADQGDFRRIVEAKLNALGVDPQVSESAGNAK
jgi:predicted negative regulator of RcsB-dependent stress response